MPPRLQPPAPRGDLRALPALRELATPASYMARHARSFRFAALLLRGTERDRVARVYAWCRFTDDLVDAAAVRGTRVTSQQSTSAATVAATAPQSPAATLMPSGSRRFAP